MKEDEKQEETQASETQEEETQEEAETSEEKESKDVDYEKELEMARKELEKKDKRIGQAEHVIEKLKSEGSQVNQENIEEMVSRLVEDKVNGIMGSVRNEAIDSLVQSYSSSEKEAELIKFHLENSIKPSGDDVTDIVNAKALANKARFTQQSSEIKRASLKTEAEKQRTSGEKNTKPPKKKLTAEERKILKAYGVTEEELETGVRG